MESFWRRYRTILLIGALALVALCIVPGSFLLVSTTTISPSQVQIAQHGLLDPASATLHLGHFGDITGWKSAGPNDYAVQDGMVILPEMVNDVSLLRSPTPMGDLKGPVLVYAPDGRTLYTQFGPPFFHGLLTGDVFYMDEWYLSHCRSVARQPLWWECMLLVGSSI